MAFGAFVFTGLAGCMVHGSCQTGLLVCRAHANELPHCAFTVHAGLIPASEG
jgi:hypothetical protein